MSLVVGWYVHHHGHGHRHRAVTVARELTARGVAVTGLSSALRPDGWVGDWVLLPKDDGPPHDDVAPGGRLHWVPRGHEGLRRRMAAVSRWIDRARPDVVVVDVSVEVGLLARLHGVPVVSFVLPGDRTDAPHALLHDVADALLGAWPTRAHGMVDAALEQRVVPVGAISRFDDADPAVRPEPGTVLLMLGSGGDDLGPADVAAIRRASPEREWRVVGGAHGEWCDDPWSALGSAELVVTHAGQNAVAEVAAARRPAVVVAQERPHGEQARTAAVLDDGPFPALAAESFAQLTDPAFLAEATALPGAEWDRWNDGLGAGRAADAVLDVVRGGRR